MFGSKWSRSQKARGRNRRELADLRGLLTQCSQAVASFDSRIANELLKRIRDYSLSYGNGTQTMAHYFLNALEARLAGTGTTLYAALSTRRTSAAEMLKAYQAYVTACPFHQMSNTFENKSIGNVSSGVARLHIVDFGILYVFQWPCIIQGLSYHSGGPPKLRITGEERLLFEREVIGREAMNVIACEVTERVERPETYKQWQVRNQRAVFRQLLLKQDIMEEVRTKKLSYHKDFVVGEDGNWILQDWKGRIIYALSCWKSDQYKQ
ncbi:unnamed protein product [Ilex paraguariensis]|uniref:Scarecrow-like protein 14 n=1 Tax=Ilex paraguariensis TaxID=185542 RepID=A0ABC8UJB0_9AQUA